MGVGWGGIDEQRLLMGGGRAPRSALHPPLSADHPGFERPTPRVKSEEPNHWTVLAYLFGNKKINLAKYFLRLLH